MQSSPELEELDPQLLAWKRATKLRLGAEARELVMQHLSEYGKRKSKTSDVLELDLDLRPEHI